MLASARLTALAITVFDLLCVMTCLLKKRYGKTAKPYSTLISNAEHETTLRFRRIGNQLHADK